MGYRNHKSSNIGSIVTVLACAITLTIATSCADTLGSDDDGGDTGTDAGGNDDPDNHLELVGQFAMPVAADIAVHADRGIAIVSGWEDWIVELIDVSDPASPTRVATIDNVFDNTDVQLRGDLLYVNHDNPFDPTSSSGISIYDISDPSAPTLVRSLGAELGAGGTACHNLWIQSDRDLMYCASTASWGVVVMAIGDGGQGSPEAPVRIADIDAPGDPFENPDLLIGAHDMYAIGNRLYVAWLQGGFSIYDISDASNPVHLANKTYEAPFFTHTAWPTEDGNYLVTTDEEIGGHMRVWDIRDLDNIVQIGRFAGNDTAVIHNTEIVGSRVYISYYTEGVKVVDLSDPANPREIGDHDMVTGPDYPADAAADEAMFYAMSGVWGIEPVPPYVYASHVSEGLYIYKMNE